MAKKPRRPVSKGQTIKFTLEVKAVVEGGAISAIDFNLNLNPDQRVLQIEEQHSGYEELIVIFDEIKKALGDINQRTDMYNETVKIDSRVYSKYFREGYQENIQPSFKKIDKIHYTHNSPETSNVSYTKSYNGDLRPSNK